MGFKKWYKRQNDWVKWGLKGVLVNFIWIWIIGFLPYSVSSNLFENSFFTGIVIVFHLFPTFLSGCSGEDCLLYRYFVDPFWSIFIGFLGGILAKFVINQFKKPPINYKKSKTSQ